MQCVAIRANHVLDGEDFRAVGGTVLVDDRRIGGLLRCVEVERPFLIDGTA